MKANPPERGTYLRGAGRLTGDAFIGATDLVEAMHRTISTFGGIFAGEQRERTDGLTGFIYSKIRAVATLAGDGIDSALSRQAVEPEEDRTSRGREVAVAVLNGILGDHLVATKNPLAISMQLRRRGQPISAEDPELHELVRQAGGRVLLLIHGSSSDDLNWDRKGHDHGAELADELGHVPIYLYYNSGRHISRNGADLADLLDTWFAKLPEVTELTIVAHSMGGLVARSACHYADVAGYGWRESLKKLVFLATPHHGALLERSGNWVDRLLQTSPFIAPLARVGKIRSAGVTDLRHGNLLHEDWQARGRFKACPDRRQPVPLPDGVECYTVAATLGASSNSFTDQLVGDGLVQLNSALGRHDGAGLSLGFPDSHQFIIRSTSHRDVLCEPQVYKTIRDWIRS